MAWDVSLLGLNVWGNTIADWYVYTIEAIDYCIDMNVDFINISLGRTDWGGTSLQSKIEQAYSNNILIVSIAQNDNNQAMNYPGAFDDVMAIAATRADDVKEELSNYGDWVECTATIEDLGILDYDYITNSHKVYIQDGHTSQAAPSVAGLAALIKSINPNLTNVQIRSIINTTCDNIYLANQYHPEWCYKLGSGRINAYEALKYTLENYGGTFPNGFTIQSGELWTFESGVVVKFASGTGLTVNGRIVADGVTFQAESGSWDGIYINSTSASSINNCTITGCEYGLTLEGSGIHTVYNSTVKGSSAAIYIKGSCNPIINNCTLIGTGNSSSNSYAAVVYSAGNSSGKINNCLLISENGSSVKYGHYNTGTATPAYNYPADGLSIINGQYFNTTGSNIYVTGGYPYFDYGSNTITSDNLSAQYNNGTGSSRNARYNYWESTTPSTSGTVVTSPIRTTPHPNVGPSKISADRGSAEDEYLTKAWKNYFDNNFTEAKKIAKKQFENNSKEEISTELLFLWMKSAMREGTLEVEETNLQTINKNTSINETTRFEAVRWLSKLAIREGDFETAESYIASIPMYLSNGKGNNL